MRSVGCPHWRELNDLYLHSHYQFGLDKGGDCQGMMGIVRGAQRIYMYVFLYFYIFTHLLFLYIYYFIYLLLYSRLHHFLEHGLEALFTN